MSQIHFRYRIPQYAKDAARKGLILRKQVKFSLSKSEAQKLGIQSGVERAYQLIRLKHLSIRQIKSIARFYSRFKGCKTKKCEGALLLCGGREFGKRMVQVMRMLR